MNVRANVRRRCRRRAVLLRGWAAVCLCACLAPRPGYGQAASAPADSLRQRVSLRAEAMPLRQALRLVEQQAGVGIVYSDALVEGVVVRYGCTDTPWREALAGLLAATPLTFREVGRNHVVLVKKPEARAQRRVTVQGAVRDAETGETLPYANVALKGTPYGASSNADGYFSLVQVPAGDYVLAAQYVGYERREQPVRIGADGPSVTVRMRPQPVALGEVTVTVPAPTALEGGEAPSLVQLSPRRLATLPSFGETDLFRALHLLPGVQSTNDGSVNLFVRGGAPDQNLVLLDGMTIYFVDHFFGFISAFNAEAIKNVQFFKGGFPARYGGRTASVVELTGRTGSFERRQVSAQASLLSGGGTVQMPLSRRAALLLTFRRSLTDVLRSGVYTTIFDTVTGQQASTDARDPENEVVFNDDGLGEIRPDFYYYDVNGKLSLAPSARDVVTLSLYNGKDDLDQTLNEAFSFPLPEQPGATVSINEREATTSVWGNTGLSVSWSRRWNERFYTKALLASSRYHNRHRYGYTLTTPDETLYDAAFELQNTVEDVTLRLDHEWHLNERHKLDFGVWFSETEARYAFTYTEQDSAEGVDEVANGPLSAFYVQDAWTPLPGLKLTAGLRATSFEPTEQTYVEPRLAARLALGPKVYLKGAWGQYRQLVNRVVNDDALAGTRDFWVLSNRDLPPSFAEDWILGAAYEDERYLIDLEAYYKDLDGVTEFSQRFDDDPNAFILSGTGTARGLEVLAQRKTGRVKGWASYTAGKVEYTFDALNGGAPFPAAQDRPHTVKAVGEVALGAWTLAASWTWASGRPYTVPESRYGLVGVDGRLYQAVQIGRKNAERLSPYHRLDASLTRRLHAAGTAFDVQLSLMNLYDRQNVWYRQYRLDTRPVRVRDVMMLGFTPMISIRANFDGR